MATNQTHPTPPPKPAWWDTDVPVEDVAGEFADYIDAVDQYTDLICTPEHVRERLRELLESAGYTTPPG